MICMCIMMFAENKTGKLIYNTYALKKLNKRAFIMVISFLSRSERGKKCEKNKHPMASHKVERLLSEKRDFNMKSKIK